MSNKLDEYLIYFLKQKEAGLVIVEGADQIEEAKNQIAASSFVISSSWQAVLENFRSNKSVCLVLDENFSKEDYDLIAQYAARQGAVQIMDKPVMKLLSVQFSPFRCRLLLLAEKNILAKIEKNYPIKDKVGLIERI